MKKSVIILILLAALVIIVSPGIIGKLAEESVSDNLDWAAEESGELVVTSDGFERGWFSSEGVHRVEIGDGELRMAYMERNPGADGTLPALIINTRIDHGIIPVSSITRDKGSLAPGLGQAVSTLSIEGPNGNIVELPGTIYSKLGLGGDFISQFVLDAGSYATSDAEMTWEPGEIVVEASAKSGDAKFKGNFGKLSATDENGPWSLDSITFDGSLTSTPHGFYVGDLDFEMGALMITQMGMSIPALNSATVEGSSSIDDGRLNGNVKMNIDGQGGGLAGGGAIVADMELKGFDAAAWGAITRELDRLSATGDAASIMSTAEEDMKDLMAAGFEIDIKQFDVGTPMGLVETRLSIDVSESDRSAFAWSSLLLAFSGDAFIRLPESLVTFASAMNPQAGAFVEMGLLQLDGEHYTLDAKFESGLLTVNGTPMPIPLGAFQ